MATLTGHLVADTYRALLKLIDNDVLTASEKQISDGFGGGSNVFIDQNGFLRAAQYKVTGGSSSQFLKANGSLDSNTYLPTGTTTSAIAEGSNLYFTQARVLATTLGGFVAIAGTVTAADTVLTSIEKIWYNIINGGGGGGGGYVPYIGATQDLNLGTFGLIGDFVQFNTTNSAIPVGAGTMAFNNIDGTADIRLKGGNVNLPIGQQEVVRVVNVTGASLLGANYQAVYISGAVGQILQVDLALAVTGVTSAGTLGLVSETIADTLEGFITSSGLVREIDTTGDLQGEIWADGDILYLSPTVAGQITNVAPIAPDLTVIIGYVVYADAIDGKIFVKVNGGINVAGDINYVPKFDSANSITNSLIYDDGTDIGIATISPTFPADRSGLVIRANGVNSSEILMQSSINTDATIQGLAIANIFDEGGAIYQRANQHLRFGTNNLERMRLTEGGYLAIGLTAPSSIIHAKDSTAYGKIIIDNNGLTGGGSFSAMQNSTETAIFGVSGAWASDTTSDAAVVATRASQGIKFYTNGSTTAKGGIDSVGDSFIGQLPAYYAGVTNFIVQGIAAGSLIGITHFDGTIKGIFSTLNSGVNIGSDTPHPVIFRADDTESARIASDGKWLFGTNVNDNTNLIQVNGSMIATSLKKSGGIATEFLKADGSVDSNTYYLASNPSNFITLTSISTTASGLTYNNTTGVISLTVGYVIPLITATTTWDTAYNNRISSLTTIGDSGNATFISNVLNIPTVTLSGIGGQPIATNLTSLSTLTYVSTSFVKMTGSGAFSLDTNTYYLASNPSSFIPLTALSSTALGLTYTNTTGVFSLTAGYMIPTSVQAAQWNTAYTNTISSATGPLSIASNVISIALATASVSGYLSASDFNLFNGKESVLTFSTPLVRSTNTISINQASGSVNGYLSSTDWTTFNGKQATISLTTTATSGPATLVGSTLNVPNYSAGSSAVRNISTFTATSGQTTFTIIGGYTVGLIDVFINGARLSTVDFTATNSSTVVLGTGAVLNDIVDVVNYTATFTAGISGTGTANFLTKWTGTSTVSNSLLFDNGTNVGISTSSPAYKLDVNGTGRFSGAVIIQNTSDTYALTLLQSNSTSTGWGFLSESSSGTLKFARFSASSYLTPALTLTSDGNLGLGTTAPTARLEVFGGESGMGQFTLSGTYGGIMRFVGNGVNKWAISVETGLASDKFGIFSYAASAYVAVITTGGSLGIGTSSPTEKLSIGSAGKIAVFRADNTRSGLFYCDNDATKIEASASSGDPLRMSSPARLEFYTNSGERMRISTSGNIGINTTGAAEKLIVFGTPSTRPRLVVGGINTSTLLYSSYNSQDNPAIEVNTSTTNGFAGLLMSNGNNTSGNTLGVVSFVASGTSGEDKRGALIASFLESSATSSVTANLVFYTAVSGGLADRMRINSSGSVLINSPTDTGPKLSIQGIANSWTAAVKGSSTNNQSYGMYIQAGTTSNDYPFIVGKADTTNLFYINGLGAVTVVGSLSKGSGSFKIDHPLKPKTHQLVHSFIEGPQADLIYRGKLILINGKAQANIDEVSTMTQGTFESLCRDIQCFTTNENGFDLVKGKVIGNIIYIESQNQNSSDEISWMVIGERKDKHMMETEWTDDNGKVIVEPLKTK